MSDGWRPVVTHPGYLANVLGEIQGPSGRTLRPMRQAAGHLYVITPKPRMPRKLFVHRAVLIAFVGLPPSPGHEGRHLDGDPSNNRLENLAWGLRIENAADRVAHGRYAAPHIATRLNPDIATQIRRADGSARKVAQRFGISHTTVLKVRRRERWTA